MQRLLDALRLDLGYSASIDVAREALEMRARFNVIIPESDWKADLIVRHSTARTSIGGCANCG